MGTDVGTQKVLHYFPVVTTFLFSQIFFYFFKFILNFLQTLF